MWFQQDGAPAHTTRIVKTYLSRRFPNRWIGIGSEIHEFPSRSPDLILLILWISSCKVMSKTLSMQKNQRPEKTWKTAFEKRAGVLVYSSCTPQCQTSIPPSSRALHLTKRTCLRTFNTIKCVSWLYWLEHSSVLPSLITKFYLHWLDRLLLILPSLTESSFDLTFTGWIVFFWFYLHWLDHLLILPSLAGSSSDLVFTGCIFFWFWFYWLRSKFFGLVV